MSVASNPESAAFGGFDPVTLEIYWSRLTSIADEAAAGLVRTAFSTIVRDSNDYATVLMDRNGNSISENTGGIATGATVARTRWASGVPRNDARKKARECSALRDNGKDPIEERRGRAASIAARRGLGRCKTTSAQSFTDRAREIIV